MNEVWVSLVVGVITFFSTWGSSQAKIKQLEKDIDKQRDVLEEFQNKYVSYIVFHEVVTQIRGDHRELKEDVKTVINILNEFKRGS